MSKLGMDLSKFKKVGSDGKSTILKHIKDGHEIRVLHKSVDKDVLDNLGKLKTHSFADGGEVGEDEDLIASADMNPDPIDTGLSQDASIDEALSQDSSMAPAEQKEVIPGMAQPEVKTPSADMLKQSLDDQISGASQVANAQIKLSGETQKLEQENAQNQIKTKEDYLKAQAPLLAKEAELNSWLEAHPENSKRYIDNMSTGGKIRTAIGLMLGGIGAGLTHGPNLAFQYLQKQIDHDIEEQRSQISTKKGLLAHNMQQMGNMRDAYTMTKIQNNEIMASHLKSAAAKAQGTAAQGTLMQMVGKFKQQNIILNSKLVNAGGVNKNDAQYIKTVNDRKANIDTNVDKAISMIEKKGTYEAVGPHNANLDRIMDQVAVDMAKLQDPNSVARPGEVELVKKGLVESGIFQQNKTAIQKLKEFKKEVANRATIAHQSRGVSPQSEIKTMNGVKYQKVQGGWKKVQ